MSLWLLGGLAKHGRRVHSWWDGMQGAKPPHTKTDQIRSLCGEYYDNSVDVSERTYEKYGPVALKITCRACKKNWKLVYLTATVSRLRREAIAYKKELEQLRTRK